MLLSDGQLGLHVLDSSQLGGSLMRLSLLDEGCSGRGSRQLVSLGRSHVTAMHLLDLGSWNCVLHCVLACTL